MIIAIAGPYSAPSEEEMQANLDRLNEAAARVLEMGHIPIIGVNAALPIVDKANVDDPYKAIMDISMTAIAGCDALLFLAESPGANREREWALSKGLIVCYSLNEIPRKIV